MTAESIVQEALEVADLPPLDDAEAGIRQRVLDILTELAAGSLRNPDVDDQAVDVAVRGIIHNRIRPVINWSQLTAGEVRSWWVASLGAISGVLDPVDPAAIRRAIRCAELDELADLQAALDTRAAKLMAEETTAAERESFEAVQTWLTLRDWSTLRPYFSPQYQELVDHHLPSGYQGQNPFYWLEYGVTKRLLPFLAEPQKSVCIAMIERALGSAEGDREMSFDELLRSIAPRDLFAACPFLLPQYGKQVIEHLAAFFELYADIRNNYHVAMPGIEWIAAADLRRAYKFFDPQCLPVVDRCLEIKGAIAAGEETGSC